MNIAYEKGDFKLEYDHEQQRVMVIQRTRGGSDREPKYLFVDFPVFEEVVENLMLSIGNYRSYLVSIGQESKP